MSAPTLRRSVTTLNARLSKQAQTSSAQICRRSGSVLQNGTPFLVLKAVRAGQRSLWTSSRTSLLAPLRPDFTSQEFIRRNSGKSEQGWKQWKFEDVRPPTFPRMNYNTDFWKDQCFPSRRHPQRPLPDPAEEPNPRRRPRTRRTQRRHSPLRRRRPASLPTRCTLPVPRRI